ncbi:MAG: NADH-quinone oxidoreductase subunit H [Nitrospira sp. ST-bin4]|uniref:NADH-quinone oxidoreductase subunit NuoH n=1 Tax=Nitrospira cf. moscoviensis SBR1015 TaxID=96242 RepID=UPI000A0CA746|nr:NADH-quinone oxidoreductase subunit NuoH [Nitrospira cf. moscoviensis SBR1015]MBY0248556.1 NADH-quinone oxidoreductase subunit NuoH [Nitrospiraceae bacterium]OQW35617.1 MAG: NADH-quinone oxidoreductase [Nitrospira sp. SG-bin2]OQW64230.1 MAG: NADH-quinone oxidoreductase subunit H [Nitrospira sp. ST-bin4]
MTELGLRLAVSFTQIAAVTCIVIVTVLLLTLAERKVLGWMQDRMGPMEVGPYGILQPFADAIKLFFKEDIVPAGANKFLFTMAPILALIPALIGFAVIPWGPNQSLEIGSFSIKPFIISDINIGILYILAFASIGAYGIILGGWSSNSKYSLLGGLRSAAQVISYELNVGLSIVGVLIMAGSLSLVQITDAQSGWFWNWYVFAFPAPQIFALVVYVISAVAETNRVPFDLPEAESELVAGFFTEYSGLRFAFFYLAEYANMVLVSCVAAAMFLGGWNAPYPGTLIGYLGLPGFAWVENTMWFAVKTYSFLFLFFWLRATLPRLRYDQLMRFGWKVMLPIALANIVVTALAVFFHQQMK